jgi:type IV pilus assembly protein PilB
LGVLLVRDGLVSEETLVEILDEQHDARRLRLTGRRLGEILVERGLVSSDQVARLVAEQYELPYLELELEDIDLRVAGLLDNDQASRFAAIPISRRADGAYLLAVADPSTVVFSDEIREILGSTLYFAVVGPDALADALAYVRSRPVVALLTAQSDDQAYQAKSDVLVPTAMPDADPLFQSGRAAAQLWPPLGALLVGEGLLSDEELERALAQQRLSTSQRLGEILVERGVVAPAHVARLVAKQYELEYIELSERDVDDSIALRLPEDLARAFRAVPIARHENGALDVVIADPTRVLYSDELHNVLAAPVTFLVAAPEAIDRLIESVYDVASGRPHEEAPATTPLEPLAQEPSDAFSGGQLDADDNVETATDAPFVVAAVAGSANGQPIVAERTEEDTVEPTSATPVLAIVGDTPREAVRAAMANGAEAIHLSHQQPELRIRARIDGSLSTARTFSDEDIVELVAELAADPTVELHLVPTHTGSKLTVLPCLASTPPRSLLELGFGQEAEDAIRAALGQPGVVVVTGVPGSGVTSTLYAALGELGPTELVIATIESRVTAIVDGVDQIEVHEGTALDAGSALRMVADCDTDVVVVDAPLDEDAAELAFRTALGGSRVLIGLREPDAGAAIAFLARHGIDADLLESVRMSVVGVHLVRTLCSECREAYYASPTELAALDRPTEDEQRLLVRAPGCTACAGRGFRGHRAIAEVVTVTDALRQHVREGVPEHALRAALAADGAQTLREQAILLCLEGVTTPSEVARVPGAPAS